MIQRRDAADAEETKTREKGEEGKGGKGEKEGLRAIFSFPFTLFPFPPFEVQRLGEKIDHARESEAHEREKMALRFENEMLKFERRLSPGKSSNESKDKE